jgi:heat shock protein HslJ
MACVDDQIMQQEQGYLQALNSSGKFEQAGDELRIEYNKGTDVLIFKKGIPGS